MIIIIAVSVVLYLYVMSGTLVALYEDRKSGQWDWKKYFSGGLKKLPGITLWYILVILLARVISIFVLTYITKSGVWNWVILALIGYATAFIPIEYIAGNSIRDAVRKQFKLIKENMLKWLLTGIYIFLLVIVSQIVIINLWDMAVQIKGTLIKILLVLGSEFARSAATVVILSTVINLLFVLKYKAEDNV
ncbi:hypothetical protein ACFLUV_06115 [Elusimicrobiota bacterium]